VRARRGALRRARGDARVLLRDRPGFSEPAYDHRRLHSPSRCTL
jgi:hypothetical protein